MNRYMEKFRGFIKTAEVGLSATEYRELLSEIILECDERRNRIPVMNYPDEGGHVQLNIFPQRTN